MSQSIRQRRALRQYVTQNRREPVQAQPKAAPAGRQPLKSLFGQIASGLGLGRTA